MTSRADPSEPAGTRAALIAAATQLFGAQGYDATSTRDIAARAGTNIASIAYHFGGKAGLRLACGAAFAERLTGVMGGMAMPEPQTPDAARSALRAMLAGLIRFLLGEPQAADLAAFLVRELAEAGAVLDAVYPAFMEPTHRRLCQLWGRATGQDPEDPQVRLSVFAMLGQVLYFRIGSAIVARRMGWDGIGPAELSGITELLLSNLDAMLRPKKGN